MGGASGTEGGRTGQNLSAAEPAEPLAQLLAVGP